MRALATRLLARVVRRASDARLERWFGAAVVQRAIFSAMAAGFDARAADGFQGRLVYELSRSETRSSPRRWTVEVLNGRAVAHPGAAENPALIFRLRLADFVRIAAGTLDPAMPLLQDRASLDGDFGLAARIPEMFRAPRPR